MFIIHTLHDQLKEFYEPIPNAQGTIQVIIEENHELNHYYGFHENLTCNSGITKDHQAKVCLPLSILETILKNSEVFDPLDSSYSQWIKVEGDIKLVDYLIQLIKRPSSEIKSIIQNVRSKSYSKIDHVVGVEKATPNILLKAMVDSYPLLARGLLKWDMIKWSIDDLDKKFGDVELRENVLRVKGKIGCLSDYIREIRNTSNTKIYTSGSPLPKALYDYFTFPFFDNFYFYSAQIWLGRNEHNSPATRLHCDFGISFLAQIWGQKKVFLYSPDQHQYLYPVKSYNTFQPCLVDPSNPSYEVYPEFRKSSYLEVTLNPGDLLIIPTGWYHCVWTTGTNFSISRALKENIAHELYNNQEIL